jgi:acyl carrier protein
VVTAHTFTGEPAHWPAHAPIGKPIANTSVYVLDPCLEPLPLLAPGELYLGGVQLARGYVGRPALTAARFVPDPYSKTPGARLYKTGDQARFLSSGDLEYIQRLDHMIKIRGFRVEPKEIEAAMLTSPRVSSCVVIAAGGGAGKTLIAYLVPAAETTFETAELRAHLAETLPHYMIPAEFVVLDALPLSPNQKIDRKRLPAPHQAGIAPTANTRPAETDAERLMVRLWNDILGKTTIGPDTNFFDAGGHSLAATRLLSSVRQTFDIEPDLADLFGKPTVAGLLEAMAEQVGGREILEEIAATVLEIEAMSAEEIQRELAEPTTADA